MTWLDAMVDARRAIANVNINLNALKRIMRRTDIDFFAYDQTTADAIDVDDLNWRIQAITARRDCLVEMVDACARDARLPGATADLRALAGLVGEVIEIFEGQVSNYRSCYPDSDAELDAAVDAEDAGNPPVEDPFIDRLEEHPGYEDR